MTRRLTAVLLLLVCTGCSRKKTLTSDDLKSQLTRAISFASEEEMFVDYIRAGRATSNFAEQHATYLDAEIQRSADELAKAVPQPRTQSSESGLQDPRFWSAACCAARMRIARGDRSLGTPGKQMNESHYLSAEGSCVAKRSALKKAFV